MLRIEAYTVLDGLALRAVGTCQRTCGSESRHEGDSASTLVSSDEIEEHGMATAVVAAIVGLTREFPDLVEFVHH